MTVNYCIYDQNLAGKEENRGEKSGREKRRKRRMFQLMNNILQGALKRHHSNQGGIKKISGGFIRFWEPSYRENFSAATLYVCITHTICRYKLHFISIKFFLFYLYN